jgi:hypothetical protein
MLTNYFFLCGLMYSFLVVMHLSMLSPRGAGATLGGLTKDAIPNVGHLLSDVCPSLGTFDNTL